MNPPQVTFSLSEAAGTTSSASAGPAQRAVIKIVTNSSFLIFSPQRIDLTPDSASTHSPSDRRGNPANVLRYAYRSVPVRQAGPYDGPSPPAKLGNRPPPG